MQSSLIVCTEHPAMGGSAAMATLAEEAVDLLRDAGVKLDPGLSEAEMGAVEQQHDITFGDDHRALLSLAVPVNKEPVRVGYRWVDWRHDDETAIRWRLDRPYDEVVFDVFHNDFWPASWGPRPSTDAAEIEAVARCHMAAWPKLIPVYSHRYLPAAPAPLGSPVFSVVQTDVIHYGSDLVNYLTNELFPPARGPLPTLRYRYHPWSDFEMSPTNENL